MDDLGVDGINEMDDLAVDEIRSSAVPENDNLPINELECRGREPLGEKSFEPYVGMEFSSKKEAYDFYNMYGYITGFSIRMSSSSKNTKGVVTSMRLVCSKEGFSKRHKHQMEKSLGMIDSSYESPKRQTSRKRCNCKAAYRVRLHEDGIWRVTVFHKDHNHELLRNSPSKKRHLRSHKQIPMEVMVENLKRWTRDANGNIKEGINEEYLEGRQGEELECVMLNVLNEYFERIAKEAVKSRATFDIVCRKLIEIEEELIKINNEIDRETAATTQNCDIGDPPVLQCMGKRKPQQLKFSAEVKDAKNMKRGPLVER